MSFEHVEGHWAQVQTQRPVSDQGTFTPGPLTHPYSLSREAFLGQLLNIETSSSHLPLCVSLHKYSRCLVGQVLSLVLNVKDDLTLPSSKGASRWEEVTWDIDQVCPRYGGSIAGGVSQVRLPGGGGDI